MEDNMAKNFNNKSLLRVFCFEKIERYGPEGWIKNKNYMTGRNNRIE